MPVTAPRPSALYRLTEAVLGKRRAGCVLSVVAIDPELERLSGLPGRAEVAMALNAILLSDLLERVPTASAHVAEIVADGGQVRFDHGALRTIDGPTGDLAPGHAAFARILEPLGYELAGTYPLPRLNMTGRAFVHRDLPESVPQFFISELHVDQLPQAARQAAERVFGASRDPLGAAELAVLDVLAREGCCPVELAATALPGLAWAFSRQHPLPALADYRILRDHSPEAAWIATEGNAFNHAADRVPDVAALAARLLGDGWPLKPDIEVSANGRIRQTAFLADKVLRQFHTSDGEIADREVPGSFYEFISRGVDPATGKLDLSFDTGNATGIFTVTSAP